ncbi:branched-chain amino acid transaminase [bacterium]|nr:branched-chain amino acid transaminase [bacterium]
MSFNESSKVWKDGKLIDWKEATIHLASHVVHYGTSVFEGIRCYKTANGSAIFRLKEHVERLFMSARIYRMPIPHSVDEVCEACRQIVRVNGFAEAYVRPVVYRGYGALGVNPAPCPVETAVMAWQWGAYLGKEALEKGVDVCVSSWQRLAPNTMPTLAKAGANYMGSQLIKMEALANGYTEGIGLTVDGFVSEGSGENLFLVYKGKAFTPPISSSLLSGITRDTVMTLLGELKIPVVEQVLPREMLYIADELFFTGTAAEVSPIRSVDRIQVGQGSRGPVTRSVQESLFGILSGSKKDTHNWLDRI